MFKTHYKVFNKTNIGTCQNGNINYKENRDVTEDELKTFWAFTTIYLAMKYVGYLLTMGQLSFFGYECSAINYCHNDYLGLNSLVAIRLPSMRHYFVIFDSQNWRMVYYLDHIFVEPIIGPEFPMRTFLDFLVWSVISFWLLLVSPLAGKENIVQFIHFIQSLSHCLFRKNTDTQYFFSFYSKSLALIV